MPTEDEVIRQIKSLPKGDVFLPVTDTKDLVRLLDENESILAFIDGDYSENEKEDDKNYEYGVLFATEKRLLYMHKGLLWGRHVASFPYDEITSLQYSSALISGCLHIHIGGRTVFLKNAGTDVGDFAEYVRHLMADYREKQSPSSPGTSSPDFLSGLERLAALHASRALTDEEFTVAKRKLLDMDT